MRDVGEEDDDDEGVDEGAEHPLPGHEGDPPGSPDGEDLEDEDDDDDTVYADEDDDASDRDEAALEADKAAGAKLDADPRPPCGVCGQAVTRGAPDVLAIRVAYVLLARPHMSNSRNVTEARAHTHVSRTHARLLTCCTHARTHTWRMRHSVLITTT